MLPDVFSFFKTCTVSGLETLFVRFLGQMFVASPLTTQGLVFMQRFRLFLGQSKECDVNCQMYYSLLNLIRFVLKEQFPDFDMLTVITPSVKYW